MRVPPLVYVHASPDLLSPANVSQELTDHSVSRETMRRTIQKLPEIVIHATRESALLQDQIFVLPLPLHPWAQVPEGVKLLIEILIPNDFVEGTLGIISERVREELDSVLEASSYRVRCCSLAAGSEWISYT